MITLGRKLRMFDTKSSHELHLEELGLMLSLPDGLYSPEDCTVYEAAVQGLWGGNFEFPADTHLISSVCYISLSPSVAQLEKPVTVQLVHSAHLTSSSQSQYLSFVVARVNLGRQPGPFKFEFLPGGSFLPGSQIGSIEVKSFSLIAIVMGVAAGLLANAVAGPVVGVATGVAAGVAAGVAIAGVTGYTQSAKKLVTGGYKFIVY